jgi:hypothetical protein
MTASKVAESPHGLLAIGAAVGGPSLLRILLFLPRESIRGGILCIDPLPQQRRFLNVAELMAGVNRGIADFALPANHMFRKHQRIARNTDSGEACAA